MSRDELAALHDAKHAAQVLQIIAEESVSRGATEPLVLQWLRDVEALCAAKVAGVRPS